MSILSSVCRSSRGSGKFIAGKKHRTPCLPGIQRQKTFCLGTDTKRQLHNAGGVKG